MFIYSTSFFNLVFSASNLFILFYYDIITCIFLIKVIYFHNLAYLIHFKYHSTINYLIKLVLYGFFLSAPPIIQPLNLIKFHLDPYVSSILIYHYRSKDFLSQTPSILIYFSTHPFQPIAISKYHNPISTNRALILIAPMIL